MAITIEQFLASIPDPDSRQAAERLITVVRDHHGTIEPGDVGISLRGRCPARSEPNSLVWIYPPGRRGWMKTRDFSFGAGIGNEGFFENLRTDLREVLETWASSALAGMNVSDVSSVGVIARSITHAQAAENIDLLCERLANVLRSLSELER